MNGFGVAQIKQEGVKVAYSDGVEGGQQSPTDQVLFYLALALGRLEDAVHVSKGIPSMGLLRMVAEAQGLVAAVVLELGGELHEKD